MNTIAAPTVRSAALPLNGPSTGTTVPMTSGGIVNDDVTFLSHFENGGLGLVQCLAPTKPEPDQRGGHQIPPRICAARFRGRRRPAARPRGRGCPHERRRDAKYDVGGRTGLCPATADHGVVATCRAEVQRANLPPLSDQCDRTRLDRARPSGSARCTRGPLRTAALLPPPGLAD